MLEQFDEYAVSVAISAWKASPGLPITDPLKHPSLRQADRPQARSRFEFLYRAPGHATRPRGDKPSRYVSCFTPSILEVV